MKLKFETFETFESLPASRLRLGLGLALGLGLFGACSKDEPSPPKPRVDAPAQPEVGKTGEPGETGETSEPGDNDDALTGEAAHVIPFADRTSMGYLLLLPAGAKQPPLPTRADLQKLVEQAFADRPAGGEIDLLLTLIATPPHTTDLGFNADVDPPNDPGSPGANPEQLAAEQERQRSFDLIGLHIELLHIGIGDDAMIPSSALVDPVLTRGLSEAERKSLLGRSWALLLRADYRNQHAVRGLRLHQTLVRVVAEHYLALIHDPDTLETMALETFTERRLRAAAGNVADQIAIVPFLDRTDETRLRLSTRGMRRFGAVDVELEGLPPDPQTLQQASDLIAGVALALAKEAEVESTGFAVEVPQILAVDGELMRQAYSTRAHAPVVCDGCPGIVEFHLVERPPEAHDPHAHVVARIVAPREQSDAPNYDHPQWVRASLARLFGVAGGATPPD